MDLFHWNGSVLFSCLVGIFDGWSDYVSVFGLRDRME